MTDQAAPDHSITRDAIYYVTATFFALLTTALPALLGQPRFLPIVQTVALTTFISVALRHNNINGALRLMLIWLPIQFLVMTLLTRLLPGQTEHAFADGFAYRAAITAWFYGGAQHPTSLTSQPLAYLIELVAIAIGSLATAGLLGIWFLVRLLNQAAYGTGILLASITSPLHTLLIIPYWTLLRAAGYAPMIVLCAMPVLTKQWTPAYYWQHHRRLILIALGLVGVGLLMELFLPNIVARAPLT